MAESSCITATVVMERRDMDREGRELMSIVMASSHRDLLTLSFLVFTVWLFGHRSSGRRGCCWTLLNYIVGRPNGGLKSDGRRSEKDWPGVCVTPACEARGVWQWDSRELQYRVVQ